MKLKPFIRQENEWSVPTLRLPCCVTTLGSGSKHPFDRVDDILFILDAETRFTFVNAFALNAWDKKSDELLGRTVEEALPEKSTQDMARAFRHALETQQRTEFETFSQRHHAWVNLTLYPDDGELIGLETLPAGDGSGVVRFSLRGDDVRNEVRRENADDRDDQQQLDESEASRRPRHLQVGARFCEGFFVSGRHVGQVGEFLQQFGPAGGDPLQREASLGGRGR
jgi:PAS domain S-box-containing protein